MWFEWIWYTLGAIVVPATFFSVRDKNISGCTFCCYYFFLDAALTYFTGMNVLGHHPWAVEEENCEGAESGIFYLLGACLNIRVAVLVWQFGTLGRSLEKNSAEGDNDTTVSSRYDEYSRYWYYILTSVIRHPGMIAAALLAWIGGGTVIYKYTNDWCWSNAFYFSVQAGMSVGFGSLPERNKWSRIYSSIHVLLGASIVVGAVGYFAQEWIDSHNTLREQLKERRALFAKVACGEMTEEDAEAELQMEMSGMTQGQCYRRGCAAPYSICVNVL